MISREKSLKRGRGNTVKLSRSFMANWCQISRTKESSPIGGPIHNFKRTNLEIASPERAILVRSFDRWTIARYETAIQQYEAVQPRPILVYYTSKGFVTGYRLISPRAGFSLWRGCSALFDDHASRPGKKLSGRNNVM